MVLTLRDGEAIEIDDGRRGRILLRLDGVKTPGGFFREGEANVVVETPEGSTCKARIVEAGAFTRTDADVRLEEMFRGMSRS